MSSAPRLYQLQLLDLEIDSRRETLRSVEERFGETEELIAARTEVEAENSVLSNLEKKIRGLEYETEDLRSKIKPLDEKLYGGTIRNPKELGAMQQEIDLLKKHLNELENVEITDMEAVEEHRLALTSAKDNFATVEHEWKQSQGDLTSQRDALVKEIEQLESKRIAQVATIPSSDLATYETLRTRKAGKAVAKVERGTCQGCRISMPTTDIQRVRASEKLIYCSSCGRILFLS